MYITFVTEFSITHKFIKKCQLKNKDPFKTILNTIFIWNINNNVRRNVYKKGAGISVLSFKHSRNTLH